MIFRVTLALISCVTLNELLHFSEHYAINNSFEIMCVKHPVQCLAYTWKLIFFCCDGETDDEDDDVGKPHFWYSPSLLWIMSQSTPFHFTFFSFIPVKAAQEVPAGTAWGQWGPSSVSLRHRRARPASCATTQVMLWALDIFFFAANSSINKSNIFDLSFSTTLNYLFLGLKPITALCCLLLKCSKSSTSIQWTPREQEPCPIYPQCKA